MNWRRGLKRLLVVGYVVWLAIVFIVWPAQMIGKRSEAAFATYKFNLEYAVEEAGPRLDADLAQARWGAFYPTYLREFRDEPVAMFGVVLIPAILYGVIYGVTLSGIWLVSGFRRDIKQSGDES